MSRTFPSHQLPNAVKVSSSPPHKYNTSLHGNNNSMEICKSPDSNKSLLRPRISVLSNQKSPKSSQSSPVISKKLFTQSLRSTRNTRNKVYKCQYCPNTFNHPTRYESHLLRHSTNIELFRCELCDQSFHTKRSYKLHTFAHIEKKVT